ncbi:MAG: ABC transporter ATP-binding protein [Gammaproteobacteria bacterium]|nr:ABC transporter ATP-binding protein [Gammaproteobacteria bacterium]MCY4356129.1 ABC transporter ATP-binding protein [Gammaproteobacteria bacterium]
MSNASDTQIEFVNVSKSYDGKTQVLPNLNLSVRQGEFLTLLGPSGSGKTTCLMLLAGFESPSSGEIRVNGESIHNLPPQNRDMGMVFQNYALFPHMTVGKNLSFPLEIRKMSTGEQQRRVKRALEIVRLEGFEHRHPGKLSGGQQQRVAIARALVFEPGVVLMDEPLGALDRRLREQLQLEIRSIQRRLGVTMVYVTHDQQEAMTLSDRIAVFNQGQIQQVAEPESLYEEPMREFVARFVGDNNLLRGVVKSVSGESCQVQVGSGLIEAFMVEPLVPGDQSVLAIRPERIVFSPSMEYSNTVTSVVDDMVFQGDHWRISVTVYGQPDFVFKIPNTIGQSGILPGDSVNIGWTTIDCRALPDEHLAV